MSDGLRNCVAYNHTISPKIKPVKTANYIFIPTPAQCSLSDVLYSCYVHQRR